METRKSFLVREDGSEVVEYNAPDFPVRTATSKLSYSAGYAAASHWHHDLEALVAMDADMDYRVNGKRVHLGAGDAIIVNSKRVHYGYSETMTECTYCFCVFHADFLGVIPSIANAIEQIMQETQTDYWYLSHQIPEQHEIIQAIYTICEHAVPEEALCVQSQCGKILYYLSKHLEKPKESGSVDDWRILRDMIGYIQTHFQEKVTLEDLAAAGHVCRSRCCALFKEKLSVTPNVYLTKYRLSKACDLMRSGVNVTEAAMESGFQGLSFFSETFKKWYGITPSQYLKTIHEGVQP